VFLVIGVSVSVALVANHRADVAAQEREAAADRKAEAERKAAEAEAAQAQKEREEREEKEAAELAAAQQTFAKCKSQILPLMTALQNVDARLDVGLSQTELSAMVGRASIAYNRINVRSLGFGDCLTSGARLETAFNAYKVTVSRWNDCIYDLYCDVDSIDPMLQSKWASASIAIDKAAKFLDRLDPSSASHEAGGGADSSA
jgi:hypothetical protein